MDRSAVRIRRVIPLEDVLTSRWSSPNLPRQPRSVESP
jgi:hypothetical protein